MRAWLQWNSFRAEKLGGQASRSVTRAKHLLSVCIQQAAADSLWHIKNALFIHANNTSKFWSLLEHSHYMKTNLFFQWQKKDVKMRAFIIIMGVIAKPNCSSKLLFPHKQLICNCEGKCLSGNRSLCY